MAALVHLFVALRRASRSTWLVALAFVLGAAVVADAAEALPLPLFVLASAVAAALCGAALRKRSREIDPSHLRDVELGVLLTVVCYGALVRVDGSLDGPCHALLFVASGLVSALARPAASIAMLGAAAALELTIRMIAQGDPSALSALPNLGFMGVFAALNAAILSAEVKQIRTAARSKLVAEMDRLRDDARSYRLLGSPASSRGAQLGQGRPTPDADAERLARSGVEEIHQSVFFALRLLREALGLHTAMLLWLNDGGTHLRVSEVASDSKDLCEGPFLVGDGVFGAAIAQKAAVSLGSLKASYKLPYYVGACPAGAVLALPVFESGAIRGVLVVDRKDARAFDTKEQELAEEASGYAVRAIQNERVFVQLERAKVEQGKLYRAAEALGAATTESEVIEAGVKSAREITSVDFAAVTIFDEGTKSHEIRAVSGEGADELVGARFQKNAGLVSMALQSRAPLPFRGEYDERRQVVFTKRLAPPTVPSIIVLPLVVHERPLGTLVLGSKRRAAFGEAARGTLEVLASHMAVSLSNARMMRRLEELATTDGMTGLLNKRAMLEVAEQKIASATRFGKQLSVLVTDIDLFKRVNDTYGHDVGDVIIRGLGDILKRAKRTTDAVARFGGEEFVVICEETDARGAMLLAERVREELKKTNFVAKGQSVQVTCSLGIATFPEGGKNWAELFKAADDALYASKRGGRDRTTAWSPALASQGHAA